MHPVNKIFILIAICQVLQTSYTLRRLHRAHTGVRYWVEMLPLILATIALVLMVSRVANILPYYVGI